MAERPNILLIMADDLGFTDLGCYGGEIVTPNLDRLAEDGLRFTHFYNNAVCVATRASLLTGQYCHRVGLGHVGGKLRAGGNNVTFAEVLREAGYRTLLSGKWHNPPREGETPLDRGFDRFWGLLSGCSNYFNPGVRRRGEPEPVHKKPGDHRPWGNDGTVMHPYTPEDPDFYATDAITDRACAFLDQYGAEDQPFLLYLPYTAPHFPMQALPKDIARYDGKYLEGWDTLRDRRWERLVEMGLVEERWGISDRDDICPSWEDAGDKARWDRKMAVYAAMVECMDRGIGKVLDRIRQLGKEQNTLVLFLSDNGACGEHFDNSPDKPPGGVDTYVTVDAPWANASNTPFRKYKVYDHEGGISTPFIAHWPGIIEPGTITHQIGHVIDILPTFLDISGAEYPDRYNDQDIHQYDGRSLLPILRGEERDPHDVLFWEMNGCRAVRKGKWKAVSLGPERNHAGHEIPAGQDEWELYDMEADRCELNDLSADRPELVSELDALWREWFERCRQEKQTAS